MLNNSSFHPAFIRTWNLLSIHSSKTQTLRAKGPPFDVLQLSALMALQGELSGGTEPQNTMQNTPDFGRF